jgi:methylmalonyl-CoA/ethylmalonyl-CoA epimerase
MNPSPIGRLDHVAVAVHDADAVIPFYRDELGLPLVGDELADDPGVRLVYFDTGASYLQLVQPIRDDTSVAEWLRANGEGLHHICFSTDHLGACAERLTSLHPGAVFRAGMGTSAFFLGHEPQQVKIEVIGPPSTAPVA